MEQQTDIRRGTLSKTASKLSLSPVRLRFLGLALMLIVSTSAGFLGGWLGATHKGAGQLSPATQQVVLKTQGQLVSHIAKTVGPGVVSITTKTRGVSSSSFFGFGGATESEGAGTGVILTEGGLIVTNRHVVPSGTTSVSVTLSDGTIFEDVEVVGRTSAQDSLDIAFLKIKDLKGAKLTAVKVGDSSKMQVGDPVIAIGNALGQFENTVTSGIISGHGRSIEASSGDGSESESLEDLFQTDAAINQGNSGGPLVNLDGELIGINTAVAAEAEGIGFAIPINNVKGLIKSVVEKGKLERPYLGVVYIPLTDDLAKEYALSATRGAYIAPPAIIGQEPIMQDGPADKAGIKAGDIITKVNGQAIDQKNSLTALLGNHAVGDKVKLTILRDGKEITVEPTLAAAPTD